MRGFVGLFVLFVLGRYAAEQTSSPSDLLAFLNADDGAYPWAMCAFGRLEHACVMAAAASGGHVRVGFENNLYLPDGSLAQTATVDGGAVVSRVLQAQGVTVLAPGPNDEFDPMRHQAVMQENRKGVEPGRIVDTLQAGYVMGDRIVRPAMVSVAPAE